MITNDDYKNQLISDLRNYNFTMSKQGRLVKINKVSNKDYNIFDIKYKLKKSSRGLVSSKFSSKSAFRLKQFLLTTNIDEVYKDCFSLTLTFPTEIKNIDIAKTVLKRFCEWLKRVYNFGIVWKKEFSKNGRIHYHLILFSDKSFDIGNYYKTKDLKNFREFSRETKHYIKKSNYQGLLLRANLQFMYLKMLKNHLIKKNNLSFNQINAFNAGLDLDCVRSPGIVCYLADYLTSDITKGKKDKSYQNICPKDCINNGRWWGYVNMNRFISDSEIYNLSFDDYFNMQKDLNKQFLNKDDISIRKMMYQDKDTKKMYEVNAGLTTFDTIFLNDNFSFEKYLKNSKDVIIPNIDNQIDVDIMTEKRIQSYLKKFTRAKISYCFQNYKKQDNNIRLTNKDLIKYYYDVDLKNSHFGTFEQTINNDDLFFNEVFQTCKNEKELYNIFLKKITIDENIVF